MQALHIINNLIKGRQAFYFRPQANILGIIKLKRPHAFTRPLSTMPTRIKYFGKADIWFTMYRT